MKRPTKKQTALAFENDWGTFEAQHGYGIFEDNTGLEYICRIDDMNVFSGDDKATEQAKLDGFKFLFTNVLDTPKNRELTKNWDTADKLEWQC